MSAEERDGSARTSAKVRHSAWPGWIWALPLAVVLVVAWLLFRHFAQAGTDITIAFADTHGMKVKDTNVEYRGLKIGSVTGLALNKRGDGIDVSVTIDDDASKFLRTGTRFWLSGAHPSLTNLSSLGALLSGPTIVMQPGQGERATRFRALAYAPAFPAPHSAPAYYAVNFTGAVGGLQQGDTVTLRGFTVGEVRDVGFHYDSRSASVETPVTIALYPEGFHLRDPAALNDALVRLVGAGLRARLDQDPPLIGSYRVTLDVVPGAPTAALGQSEGLPEIPVAPGGGLQSILTRLNKVPVDQIAQNALDITHRIDTLVSSPKLADSIGQLDDTLRQIHQTAAKAGPQIAQLVQQLRSTADQIDQAAKTADKTLGGAPSQNGLNSTLQEITEAARSIRELADYLDRHPEALIKGRPGG